MTTDAEVISFVRNVCAQVKIRTIVLADGSIGLLHVPMKYCALIEAFIGAMQNLADGKPLPRIVYTGKPNRPAPHDKET